MKDLETKIEALREECVECGLCMENCLILTEIDEFPDKIAERKVTAEEAYSCCLCRLCEAVCPQELSPMALFAKGRREAIAEDKINIDEFAYLLPDRENGLQLYRQFHHIDYDDLQKGREQSTTAFFPGCTLLTYTPELLRKIMANLEEAQGPLGFMDDCCAHPLHQMGLDDRAETYQTALRKKMQDHGIHDLILACPNCYNVLKPLLSDLDIRCHTIFEKLGPTTKAGKETTCVIHDVCPDRFDGIFKQQMTEALTKAGYKVVSPEHSGPESTCCGSGGQISHFRPEFRQKLLEDRMELAKAAHGEMVVAPCINCVLNLSELSEETGLPVYHALNLLLDEKPNYGDVKKNAARMYESPEGMEAWYRMQIPPDND